MIRAVGAAVPIVRELPEVLHQFERPFVVDASDTTATFGIEPTPWDEVLAATLAGYGVRVDSARATAPGGRAGCVRA